MKLVTGVDPDLPELIVGDSRRLRQILVNLLGNAIKFMEFGEVSVTVKILETEWQMIVQDTGIGIPAERLPDIFEPFRRGSDYATRNHQGAGLGLSIVKKLVTLMDGKIEVQSVEELGSTFTVTLPLKKAND